MTDASNREKWREINCLIGNFLMDFLVKLALRFLKELVRILENTRRAELRRSQPTSVIKVTKNKTLSTSQIEAKLVEGKSIEAKLVKGTIGKPTVNVNITPQVNPEKIGTEITRAIMEFNRRTQELGSGNSDG